MIGQRMLSCMTVKPKTLPQRQYGQINLNLLAHPLLKQTTLVDFHQHSAPAFLFHRIHQHFGVRSHHPHSARSSDRLYENKKLITLRTLDSHIPNSRSTYYHHCIQIRCIAKPRQRSNIPATHNYSISAGLNMNSLSFMWYWCFFVCVPTATGKQAFVLYPLCQFLSRTWFEMDRWRGLEQLQGIRYYSLDPVVVIVQFLVMSTLEGAYMLHRRYSAEFSVALGLLAMGFRSGKCETVYIIDRWNL